MMQFCKTCGTLYDSSLPCCPKCNPILDKKAEYEASAPQADKKQIRNQWIAICIAIPALIGLLYWIGGHMQRLGMLG